MTTDADIDKGPFSLSPDPEYLYMTPLLQTAVHKLQYVIRRRQGISAILGDLGTGKSSLIRHILRLFVGREDYAVTLILTPGFRSDFAFLRAVCSSYNLPPRRSLLDQQDELQDYVIAQFAAGVNVLLLIDEAQRLDTKMLEVVRGMLNFETDSNKCIQIVLAGQLELQERLNEKRNAAIKSRIFAPTILQPLALEETRDMIDFRCQKHGVANRFTPAAVDLVYELTGGIPRMALQTCQIAYDLAELTGTKTIDADAIPAAIDEARLR